MTELIHSISFSVDLSAYVPLSSDILCEHFRGEITRSCYMHLLFIIYPYTHDGGEFSIALLRAHYTTPANIISV